MPTHSLFPVLAAPARRRSAFLSLVLAFAVPLLAPPIALATPLPEVQVIAGQDRWSQTVARDWQPRSEAAMAAVKILLQDKYGISPEQGQRWLIATSPRDAVDGDATRILLEAGLTQAELRDRALLQPLRITIERAFERMTSGSMGQLPRWLPSALADTLAQEAVETLHLPEPAALEKDIPVWLAAKRRPSSAVVHGNEPSIGRPSPKSDIGMRILRKRLGEGFHQAMKSYLMASARPGFNASAEFTAQFGISEHEFAVLVDRQWDMRPVGAALGQAGDVSPHINVRMGGYVNDGFAEAVRQNSLGLVRQATVEFDDLVRKLWHVQLEHDVTVYLAAGSEDYKQVLAQDMHTKEETAEVESEVSGGMSNRRGQIAIKFDSKLDFTKLNEKAVRTTMHELTHQMQYQLAEGKSGFRPPHWMMEGPAKLAEYIFSEQMQFGVDARQPVYDWRRVSLNWWRSDNKTGLTAQDVVDVGTGSGWLKMMKEHRGNYNMVTLMMMYLKAITGEQFFPGLANYYRLSGHTGQTHQRAFEESFAISESNFLADFNAWLAKQ